MTKSILLSVFIIYALSAHSQPGYLDKKFGKKGKVLLTYYNGILQCNNVVCQNDGKIVCVGTGYNGAKMDSRGFAIIRFLENGILDSSFGENGSSFVNVQYNTQTATAAVIQTDNKIVITGYRVRNYYNPDYDVVVVRLLENGMIDSSFGNNGIVISSYGRDDKANDITLQKDGKILVQGAYSGNFMTLRYLPDGSLDERFGDNGRVVTTMSGISEGLGIALQADGKIVASGYSDVSVAIVRYLPNGSPDSSFGKYGKVFSRFSNNYFDDSRCVALQPDGKILIAGRSAVSTLVARYHPDGTLDENFGYKGRVTAKYDGSSVAHKIAIQKDGKIITAGSGIKRGSVFGEYWLLRFLPNGQIDSAFADNGRQTTNFKNHDEAYGLALKDNKIIVAGTSDDTTNYYYLSLAQYHNDDKGFIQKAKIFAENTTITLTPNPAKDFVTINGLTGKYTKLSVIDFNGNVKEQAATNNLSYQLRTSSLKKGNYLLVIESGNEKVVRQLIKD